MTEYGQGREVSIDGDVYSYGILLLEMMTGKRPIDDTFEKGLNLHMFAKMALPDHVIEITDPVLLSERHLENAASMEECLTSSVKIGVACSMDSPRDRMDMSRVVRELLMVRDTFQGTASRPENNKYPGAHGFHS